MTMSRRRRERMVPPKRAVLALAASLSPDGSRGHRLGEVAALDEFDAVTTKLERFRTMEMGMRGRRKELEHRVPISFPVATNELETTYESSASYAGAMFDVRARDNVIISSISFNTPRTDYIKVQLYTREGGYGGHEDELSGWTLLADVAIKGRGLGNPTAIPEGAFDPVLVGRANVQSFYVTADGPDLRVARGTSEGEPFAWNTDIVIYAGVGKRYPMHEGTGSPRVWNGSLRYRVADDDVPAPAPTDGPTPRPTTEERAAARIVVPPPEVDATSFRLRLYWEEGYFWQEDSDEMWWCMGCGDCDPGDSIRIEWCGSSVRQQFEWVGGTVRPASDRSLCLTVTGHSESNPIRLRDCDDDDSDQKFDGFRDDGRFELHPRDDPGLCVSQLHHPKKAETVYPQDCRDTRDHETTYWIAY